MLQVTGTINERISQKQLEALAAISTERPVIRKFIQDFIKKELGKVQKRMQQDAKSNMKSDPRHAYKGVQVEMYKHFLGGVVSILQMKKASDKRYELVRVRKVDRRPAQRGGNRRGRSERTKEVDTYYGRDRSFILRFNNSGTKPRMTQYGNRGMIQGRRWFEMSALFQLPEALENIADMVEVVLEEEFNKRKE